MMSSGGQGDVSMLLHSQRLQFSTDGARLACADTSAVVIASVEETHRPVRIEEHDVQALAVFTDQLWALDKSRAQLRRYQFDGSRMGDASALSNAPVTGWSVPMTGTPAVLIEGTKRQLVSEQGGALGEVAIPGAGLVVPIGGRRHVLCLVDHLVRFGGGVTAHLAQAVAPVSGGAVFDGTALLLIVEGSNTRRGAIVFDIASGAVKQKFELIHAAAGEARLASKRGVLVVRTSERRFALIDLRKALVDVSVEAPVDIEDFAIDPHAKRIAIRSLDGVRVYPLAHLGLNAEPEIEVALDALVLPHETPPTTAAPAPLPAPRSALPRVSPERIAMVVGALPPTNPHESLRTLNGTSRAVRRFEMSGVRGRVSMARASQTEPPAGDTPAQSQSGTCATPGYDNVDSLGGVGTSSPKEPAPIVELHSSRGVAGRSAGASPRAQQDAAHARRVFDSHVERVYQRALSVRALAEGEADLAEAMREKLQNAITDERSPIAHLARALHLDEVECDLVWSIAACSYDPRIAPLLATFAGAHARRGLSLGAYVELAQIDQNRAVDLTLWLDDPENPLVSTELVSITEPASPAMRAYVASSRLVRFLAGDAAPSDPVRLVRVDRPLLHDEQQTAAVAQIAAALGRSPDPLIVIEGPVGSGRTTACACAARRDLLVLDVQRVGGGALADSITALRREMLLHPGIPVLANVDHRLGEEHREYGKLLAHFVDRARGPLIITVTVPGTDLGTHRPVVRVPWDVPSSPVRAQLWRDVVRALGATPAGDYSTLAFRYRVGPAAIERAVASACLMYRPDTPFDETALATGLRQNIAERMGGLARRIEVTQTWDDAVLPDDTRDRANEIIGRVRHAYHVLETWGYRKRMPLGIGVPVLFSGAPGTGKTMLAGLVARALDLELYQVDLSKVVSKWIGETEKNLARVFDAADEGHALLLFDEADALFGQRSTDMKSATDRYANLEVNYLLQRVEAFGGIVILTTNLETAIDEALKRRLAAHVKFEKPDETDRARIWKRQCETGQAPLGPDVDHDQLARMFPNMSGANIRNAVVSAAFVAAAEDAPRITQAHLIRAGRAEYHSMGYVLSDLGASTKPRSSL